MELRRILGLIWKWAWLAALAVIIASVSSYAASKAATPLYSTRTTLMIGRVYQSADPNTMQIYVSQQLAYTYIQLAQREPVLKGVIEKLGLNMDWRSLRGQVSATNVPQTQLLEISVVDSDPYRAKLLADAVAQQLILLSPGMQQQGTNAEQAEFTRQQLEDLKTKIEDGKVELERLKQELDAANSARQIQDLQSQVSVLESKISGWQNTYSQLLLSYEGGDVNTISIVEEAPIPTAPFSPNVFKNVLVAAAIGLALAVAGAFLIEYLDDTIKDPDDVARLSGLNTLAAIPPISGEAYPDKLVSIHQPLSPIVESFRILRTNLQFSALDRPLRTLMITSPGPTEGKSVTLSNLAVVMAQSGLRVILVDTDLRRPTVHRIYNLPNRQGLTDAILHVSPLANNQMSRQIEGAPHPGNIERMFENLEIEENISRGAIRSLQIGASLPVDPVDEIEPAEPQPALDIDHFIQDTPVKNLRVLTTGPLPPNPAELLGSGRMLNLIEALKAEADLVMFDAPPTLVVADAAILSTRLDGVIIVNDVGNTRTSESRRAVEELRRVHANILGVVLNRMSRRNSGYGGYYYYYYYYQHGDKNRHRPKNWIQQTFPWISRNNNHKSNNHKESPPPEA
ncbi:MAG: hypothetical protein AB1894_04105 [Chloroflexota bacterium]